MADNIRQLSFLPDEKKPDTLPSFPLWERATSLEELKKIVSACRRCRLRDGCQQVVFGEGNPKADIMLVGEGPGKNEDQVGRPFVGAAGQLLDNILEAVGLSRSEVFIGNVVKCRPPGNRMPSPDEVKSCEPYLRAQFRIIKPKIVVCLGALAGQVLVDPSLRITRDRGRWVAKENFLIMPTFHPAALLRDPRKKRPVWEDFKAIVQRYKQLRL